MKHEPGQRRLRREKKKKEQNKKENDLTAPGVVGPGGRTKGKAKGAGPRPKKETKLLPAESSDSASSDSDSSCAGHWNDCIRSFRTMRRIPADAIKPPSSAVVAVAPHAGPPVLKRPASAAAPAVPEPVSHPLPMPAPAPPAPLPMPAPAPPALPLSDPAAAPPPPHPLPPARTAGGRVRAPHGPHAHQIVSVHGKATLSRVEQGGAHVGYVITCRNHEDDGDPKGTICQKTLMFGVTEDCLTDAECKSRLKRWFIMGNDPATPTLPTQQWEERRFRSCHIRFGGRRLTELDSDNTTQACYGYSYPLFYGHFKWVAPPPIKSTTRFR